MPWLSQAAYARHRKANGLRGGTRAAVSQALKRGQIEIVNGKIDSDDADRRWPDAVATPPAPRSAPTSSQVLSAQNERARLLKHQADLAEIKVQRERGQVLDAGEVVAAWQMVVTAHRERLMLLPERLAHKLEGVADATTRKALIEDELFAIMRMLPDDPGNDRPTEAGVLGSAAAPAAADGVGMG